MLNNLGHSRSSMALEEYKTVSKWLSRLADSTAKGNLGIFQTWYKWIRVNGENFKDFTPDELIEYQSNADNSARYDILDSIIQPYVHSKKGRTGYKRRIYNCIKSFFRHNRAELPKDPAYIIRGDKPKVRGDLSADEIKRIVLSSNPLYQAVFLSMLQGGIGLDELIYWSDNGWGELKEQLQNEPQIIKISLIGRKSRKFDYNYNTFIGKDAIQAVRNYLPNRPNGARAIFIIQNGKPLTKTSVKFYWFRHLKKLGIIKLKKEGPGTRYGKNLHEIRDVFRSLWEKSSAKGSVAEFCMGHVVDPLEYNKAHRDESWTRQEYDKALQYLNIMSSGKAFGQVDEDKIEDLRQQIDDKTTEIDELRHQIDAFRNILDRLPQVYRNSHVPLSEPVKRENGEPLWPSGPKVMQATIPPDLEELITKEIDKRLGNQNTKYQIVDEQELIDYLDKGWQLHDKLLNGKLVLSKNPS